MIQQYSNIVPLETCFTTISNWLRTDQSALPASYKLARCFPQGPLDKDDGIDIVAVTDSSTLILPPNSSVSFISESCSIRKPRYTLRVTFREDGLLHQ